MKNALNEDVVSFTHRLLSLEMETTSYAQKKHAPFIPNSLGRIPMESF